MDNLHALAIVAVSSAVAFAATPFVIRFARAIGAVDRPNERKVSKRAAMPLLGGLAVAFGCAAGITVALAICSVTDLARGVVGFGGGALALIAVGLYDDRFEVRPYVKLLFQILAAGIAIEAGFRIDYFTNPVSGDTHPVPLFIAWPISLLWIVGVTNALNLIDGLDGLSAGVGGIIAGTLTIICWQAEQWLGVVVGLALFGALLGYLPYNFPPARIFLGDTGALVIGFGLAILALEGYRKTALLAFLVPLLALAIPILDTVLSIVRRLRSGRGVFSPDRLHMHHRLLQREGSHKSAVLMLYFLTACFCMIAVSFSQIDGWIAFLYLAAVVAVTIRLLRNLDAFSLEILTEPTPTAQADQKDGSTPGPKSAVPASDEVPCESEPA
ncbi:MAG: MraY family glycosyltransferase [Myxococcota bacterium]